MFISRDGRWRIEAISRDGIAYYRISHDGSEGIPIHYKGKRRAGPKYLAGGWLLVADVRTVEEIEQWIPLEELEEK